MQIALSYIYWNFVYGKAPKYYFLHKFSILQNYPFKYACVYKVAYLFRVYPEKKKTLCAFIFIPLLPTYKHTYQPSAPRLDYPSNTYRGVPVAELVIMKFSPSSHILKPVCTYQHPILQHPKHMFFP